MDKKERSSKYPCLIQVALSYRGVIFDKAVCMHTAQLCFPGDFLRGGACVHFRTIDSRLLVVIFETFGCVVDSARCRLGGPTDFLFLRCRALASVLRVEREHCGWSIAAIGCPPLCCCPPPCLHSLEDARPEFRPWNVSRAGWVQHRYPPGTGIWVCVQTYPSV